MEERPKICVAGAGAIGGMLAALLADGGFEVSIVARGETLRRIRAEGLSLDNGSGEKTRRLPADIRAPDTVQDLIILAGKAHQLPGLAATVSHAIGPRSVVLPVVNGIPWWMMGEGRRPFGGLRDLLDPEGTLERLIPAGTVIGAVAYAFAQVKAPGCVHALGTARLVLGEPDGTPSSIRLTRIAGWLAEAGIAVGTERPIYQEIWAKLAANAATNPLSVVTGADLGTLGRDPTLRPLTEILLTEAIAVGSACGIPELKTPEAHLEIIAGAGAHMTSMAQDVEHGRMTELPAIVDVLVRLGSAHGVATPALATIAHLAAYRSQRQTLPT